MANNVNRKLIPTVKITAGKDINFREVMEAIYRKQVQNLANDLAIQKKCLNKFDFFRCCRRYFLRTFQRNFMAYFLHFKVFFGFADEIIVLSHIFNNASVLC